MLFSRVVSFLAFVFTLGILAVAKPVELEARADINSVENVVATLKSKTDQIVPQIKSAASSPQVSAAELTPLFNELITALHTAQGSLARGNFGKLKTRQAESDVANTFAGVVKDIAEGVKPVPHGLPGIPGLLISLDIALSGVITALDILVVGVGVLLGGLLTSVAGLLVSLGFGLTLGLLGL